MPTTTYNRQNVWLTPGRANRVVVCVCETIARVEKERQGLADGTTKYAQLTSDLRLLLDCKRRLENQVLRPGKQKDSNSGVADYFSVVVDTREADVSLEDIDLTPPTEAQIAQGEVNFKEKRKQMEDIH